MREAAPPNQVGRDCRDILIDHIRKEKVGLDVAFWFMEDSWIASEIIARKNAGVPVRILMDTEANVSTPRNATRLAEFEAAGIPMREKVSSGILHWKMMLFSGQGIVEFSGANYSSDAWTVSGPDYTNYTDEAIYFTSKPSIVNSFRTKFDSLWTNTTEYRDYRNITVPPTRSYDIFPIDPELNFVPAESHAVRAVAAYGEETSKIDVIMYRITDSRYADAMMAAEARGVPVRLITEPVQYRDPVRQYHSWNIDRMYMAGIDIRNRAHQGLNHQKSVLLYDRAMTIFGSSNWSSASSESQEEHNLFTTDPWVFQWFVDQFERKWTNSTGVMETDVFTPLPPDQPTAPAPASQAVGVEPSAVTLRWTGGYWAHKYDVYLGTSAGALTLVGENLPRLAGGIDYNKLALDPLVPGTTYYWRVVAKTMADMTATSPLWSFTTSGTPPAPPPPTTPVITLVRQPYLQQVTPTSAVVVWATREPGDAEVRVTTPAGTRLTVNAPWTLYPATATGMAADYYQYAARITGLSSATTYTYDIVVAGEDLNAVTDTITTAPATAASTVRFVLFGDSGTGSTGQQQVASLLDRETFDLALHAGDIAYANTSGTGPASHQTMEDWFFTPYRNWLRKRPVFPSMGNHDSRSTNADGRPYLDMYVLPADAATPEFPDQAERYYSFDYGPVHVIVLDTELSFLDPARRAAQMAWAEADLAATTQPWRVALYHRSAYSAGGENGSELPVREVFAPLFDKYNVHVALSAHEHDYERTFPLRAGATDPSGTTYVVSGGGGGPLYPSGSAAWTAHSASVHHYVRGTANECSLTLEAIGVDGVAFDSVVLRQCETPTDPLPPPPPPAGAPTHALGEGDILLYAADASVLRGRWQKEADATAAAGFKLRNPDAGAAKRTTALADPADYFELTFTAVPNVPYRFWMRGKADGDVYSNDSVFVQFTGATDFGIGTTRATEYNLEDCSGCRISNWGWQDNAWGIGVASTPVTFSTAGPHTIRIQAREDGLSIDQIMFSPVKFFSTAPGALKDDTAIYPRSSTTPPPPGPEPDPDPEPAPNVAPSVALTAPADGATFTAPATIALTASAADSDGTVARVDFYAGTTLVGSAAAAPYQASWSNVAAGSYTLTARATDNTGAVTTSAAVAVTVNTPPVEPPPPPPPTSAWTSQDIGAVGLAGRSSIEGGVFSVTGAGADIWNGADAFHYVWQPLAGDADVIARVASVEYVHAWVKAGVMIRERLTADSAHALMLVSPGKGLAFQRRVAAGGSSTSTSGGSGTAPAWVKLERRGNTITAYRSADGVTWTRVGADTFTMGAEVHVGLAVSSHVTTRLATATFDQVTVTPVTAPPPPEEDPSPNAAPAVALTSPASGASFTAPAAITVAASASDSDGQVVRVDFYSGATLIGSATTAPFQASWSNVAAGSYTLTARATDNAGASTTSAPVTITVTEPAPPPPPPPSLPAPWTAQDIGAVGLSGSASAASGVFTITGAGADIWNAADAFHYVWQPLTGDADLIARVTSMEYVHAWVKAGVMIREQLTPDSPHALMLVSPGKGLAFQRRLAAGGLSTSTSGGSGTAPAWVKLERRGATITAYRSADGVSWTQVGADTFAMGRQVYVGLAVSSHTTAQRATATFDQVTVIPR